MTDTSKAEPKSAILIGRSAVLKPIGPEHVGPRYVAWMNDPQINRFLESRFVHHDLGAISRFVEQVARSANDFMFGIHLVDVGEHVGNIRLGPIDTMHQRASVGFLIGERSAQGRGVATEAVGLVAQFAFERLVLAKLTAGAYASNGGSLRVFQKSGWAREGLRRKHVKSDSFRDDVVEFGLLKEDWEKR